MVERRCAQIDFVNSAQVGFLKKDITGSYSIANRGKIILYLLPNIYFIYMRAIIRSILPSIKTAKYSIIRYLTAVAIIAFVATLPQRGYTQPKTYLGFEFGPKNVVFRATNSGGILDDRPFDDGVYGGVIVGQEIGTRLVAETGFYSYRYSIGARMNNSSTTTRAYAASQVPLRVKAPISLFNTRLSITPSLGYSVVFKNDYGNRNSNNGLILGNYPDGDYATISAPENLKKVYGLIEGGLALEWEFKSSFIVYLSGSYSGGLQKVVSSETTVNVGNAPPQSGELYSKGSYIGRMIGVRFPISPIWQHKRK